MPEIEILETGDLYYFYRNKVEVERARSLEDVQRFYLILVPDDRPETGRMFTVGRKRMPKMDARKPSGREWFMNVMTGRPHDLGAALAPIEYETKTRGVRHISEAFPAGEGRYALVDHEGHTELGHRLTRPERPGTPQKEMEIRAEASYVVSVRNPDLHVEGFPDEVPDYPKSLKRLFSEKRWIDVREPALLDYENAQLLLVGARERLDEIELEIPGTPRLFERLGLDEKVWPTEALLEGRFARAKEELEPRAPDADPGEGGRRGGRAAMGSASAAAVAKALKGIDLPVKRDELVAHAEERGGSDEVLETLRSLPDREYDTLGDVESALREVR